MKRQLRERYGEQPRGLARLDAAGLAELRQIILTVIDDGDPSNCELRRNEVVPAAWNFAGESEAATEARMRFVEVIQKAIVEAAAPAATTAKGERP